MASDDEDALLRKVRAQHRSVSFVTGSELVNIDLGDECYRQAEDTQLNETVRWFVHSDNSFALNLAFVTFRGLALYNIEKKLSECTRKNDEFNSLAKMTNSINCTKFRNN